MCLGIPGRIIEVREDRGLPMGVVDFGGVQREVCLAYVADEVTVGDYAIVHVGFAISKVDEAEARRTFAVLREMSELGELEWLRALADDAEAVMPGASPQPRARPADEAGPQGNAAAAPAGADAGAVG